MYFVLVLLVQLQVVGNHCSRCTVYTIIDCCVRACCIVTCIVPLPSCLATLHSSPCAALRPRSSLSMFSIHFAYQIAINISLPACHAVQLLSVNEVQVGGEYGLVLGLCGGAPPLQPLHRAHLPSHNPHVNRCQPLTVLRQLKLLEDLLSNERRVRR